MKNRLARTVFLIWFLSPAVYLFSLTIRPVIQGFGSAQWPSVEGRILSSEIKTEREKGPTRFGAPPGWRAIRYEYEVGGQKFEAGRIAFIRMFEKREDVPDDYKAGQSVRVFYKPDNPSLAALKPASAKDIAGGLLLPLAALGFIVCCVVLMVRTWIISRN